MKIELVFNLPIKLSDETFSSRFLWLIPITIFFLLAMACGNTVGRAVGEDTDGGSMLIPVPPEPGFVYKVSGELMSPAPDTDEWTFQGNAGDLVEIHLESSPGSIITVDTLLVLKGPRGNEIARNDDYRGVHAGIITGLNETGQHTIVAQGYGLAFGHYDLTLSFLGGFSDTDGGRINEADQSGLSISYGEIQTAADEDVWEIPALVGATLMVVLDGITSLDPTLELFDPEGVEVARSDDYVGRDSQVNHVTQMDGIYTAVVRGYGGRSTGDYYLRVSGNPDIGTLKSVSASLEMAEAELTAIGNLAIAKEVAELAEAAELANVYAQDQLKEAQRAAVEVEKSEKNAAVADIALEKLQTKKRDAEVKLEKLSETVGVLDKVVLSDVANLEQVDFKNQTVEEKLELALVKVAELEQELQSLQARNAEAYLEIEVQEKRLKVVEEANSLQSESQDNAIQRSAVIAILAENAEKAAKAEAEAQKARADIAELEIERNKAEIDALTAKLQNEAAAKKLKKESEEAAQAELVANKAAEAAKKTASGSPLTTIIEGIYMSVSDPEFGSASIVDGEIYYTHGGSPNPVDTFTATVEGEGEELLNVRMWITLTYVRPNTAPIAVDDAVKIAPGQQLVQVPMTINDIDQEKDQIAITHINGQALKPGTKIEDSSLVFELCDKKLCGTEATSILLSSKHGDIFSGSEIITYQVSDPYGLTGIGKLVISIDSVLPESEELTIMATKIGSVDVKGLNPKSSVSEVTQGKLGKVEIVDNGDDTYKVTYTHTGANTISKDEFTYTVTDQIGNQSSVKVKVDIGVLVNRNPTPVDIDMTVQEGGSTTIFLNGPDSSFKATDLDPDGHDITVVSVRDAKHGEPIRKNDWYNKRNLKSEWEHLAYFHDGGESLEDSFKYCVYDRPDPLKVKSGCGKVNVTIIPVNDSPTAKNIEIQVKASGSVTFDLSSASTDPEGDELTASIDIDTEGIVKSRYGKLVRKEENTFTYSHDGTDEPTDSFTYIVDDGKGGKSTAIVNVKVMTLSTLEVKKIDFSSVPISGTEKVEWDPEIGVRIGSKKSFPFVDALSVLELYECIDSNCDDATNKAVAGKVVELDEGTGQFISFVPDKPLYGGTNYKVKIGDGGTINVFDGSIKLAELVGRSDWVFLTADLTRFTLPINLKYNDTNCDATESEYGAKFPLHAERAGPNMCQSLEDVNNFVYGWEFKQLNNYLNNLSKGKFVTSPLRDKEGRVVKSIQLDRGKNYYEGQCFRNWEKTGHMGLSGCPTDYPGGPTIGQEISSRFDLSRYRNITDKEGNQQILAPYYQGREQALKYVHRSHQNVTMIYNWGTKKRATLGAATGPKSSYDTAFKVSHDELYRTWIHEIGHAYFGLPDLYWRGDPGPNHQGRFDIMANNKANYPPMSAWSLIESEFAEPASVVTDLQIVDLLSADEKPLLECGSAVNPCTMYSNNSDQFKIIRIPAIIERDTREVKGYYLLEYLDTAGYNSQIVLDPDTLKFPDNQGRFPGGIAIWKVDETDQKAHTSICPELGDWCKDKDHVVRNHHDVDLPEFYPSVPTIEAGGGGTTTSSFHLFPWWYSEQLPFGDDYEKSMADMPSSIELPILEIPPFSEHIDFGGGKKVATVTLSFDDLIKNIKNGIAESHKERGQSFFKEYELRDPSIKYTLTVSKASKPSDMTYKDHVRPGQLKFAKGRMWDEISVYGYQRIGVPVLKQVSPSDTFFDVGTTVVVNSSIAGVGRLSGDCVGDSINISPGDNTIDLGKLAEGVYSNCILIVKNKTDRDSWPLIIDKFSVSLKK
tara:strand:+ start:531 stop:5921 length:5391 start_codon:yes stop_codon:yes gene_type:complete